MPKKPDEVIGSRSEPDRLEHRTTILQRFDEWLQEHRSALVEELLHSASDETVRGVGLAMIELLRDVMFSRGPRDWFRHDLEFYYETEKRGVHFLPVHYYSPLPDTRQLDHRHWETYSTPGVEWRPEAQWSLLEGPLAEGLTEFINQARHGSIGQFLRGAPFVEGDLALYYAMIRMLRPRQIVEVGAGVSTRIALDAVGRNGSGRISCIEPYPLPLLEEVREHILLERTKVQDLPAAYFESLGDGDILFIDSTHVVAAGSDVNRLMLQVLPTLRQGVVVHFHDMHLPLEMPEDWIRHQALFWNEQYLVQAFLALNRDFEILISSAYLGQTDAVRYARTSGSPAGGSLWFRRAGGA